MTVDILPVAGPVAHLPPPPGGRWTVADYERLPEDGQRYELIDGELRIAPAPNPEHQTASGLIFYHLMQCVQLARHGRVFMAPLDVELSPVTIVQPDIVVILNGGAATITTQRIVGPPGRRPVRERHETCGHIERLTRDPAFGPGCARGLVAPLAQALAHRRCRASDRRRNRRPPTGDAATWRRRHRKTPQGEDGCLRLRAVRHRP